MAKDHPPKIEVSERALLLRINRKLKPVHQVVKVARTPAAEAKVGRFFVIDKHGERIVRTHIDLKEFGRELGVFSGWEDLGL
jgi:hypothetical protein